MGASCSCLRTGQLSTPKSDHTLEVNVIPPLGFTMVIAVVLP